jgi:hypothetical protein
MKKIFKSYGLTRTGTNLLHWLLTINFREYVCDIGSHGVHYLGWKHGQPPSKEIIDDIYKYTNDYPLFIFTEREYESWLNAVTQRHKNSWEFKHPLSNKSEFIYFYTPNGYEKYDSYMDLYQKKQNIYRKFHIENPHISMIVNFEDLKENQETVILNIKEKFNLNLCYDIPISIKKKISSSGNFEDYI